MNRSDAEPLRAAAEHPAGWNTRRGAGLTAVGIALTAAAVVGVIRLAAREHEDPARCGAGLVAIQSRCCAPTQTVVRRHCVGRVVACPAGMHVAADASGCVVDARRVTFRGGHLSIGADDWQSDGVQPRETTVGPFELDATEVTIERWGHCVQAGACRVLDDLEPGTPAGGIDAKEAEHFCRFEGGRLPRGEEWLFAALGAGARRFPWGEAGLVCRRAVFGLERGPCAKGGGVEIAGSRPDGATPDGVLDLVGNVAEWTLERDGTNLVRGGSYRSTSAAELRSSSAMTLRREEGDVGFRCAYDAAAPPAGSDP